MRGTRQVKPPVKGEDEPKDDALLLRLTALEANVKTIAAYLVERDNLTAHGLGPEVFRLQ